MPAEHTCPLVQARLHMPQWAPLVWRSKHVPPQSVWPLGQVHMPLEQTRPPVQRLPQELQLALSVAVFTQLPLQLLWPD